MLASRRRAMNVELLRDVPDAPLWVQAGETRLRQILGNLLTNALMHAGPGAPIEVRLGEEGDRAVIEVRDHGVGMDEATAARVFERFYRADKARSRAKGGSGLGLAIVKHIVARHRGRLKIESTAGQGSRFTFILPG